MNRFFRRKIHTRGFRPGNVPYFKTELRDVIISTDPLTGRKMIYQVKSFDNSGKPVELFETTYWRAVRISWRFKLNKAKMFILKPWNV